MSHDCGLSWVSLYSLFAVYQNNLSVFVCVEVIWPSQPNGVMLSAVSLPNHILLDRFSPLSG